MHGDGIVGLSDTEEEPETAAVLADPPQGSLLPSSSGTAASSRFEALRNRWGASWTCPECSATVELAGFSTGFLKSFFNKLDKRATDWRPVCSSCHTLQPSAAPTSRADSSVALLSSASATARADPSVAPSSQQSAAVAAPAARCPSCWLCQFPNSERWVSNSKSHVNY